MNLVAHVAPTESSEPSEAGWQLLKSRDFSLLYAGQLISQIGDGLNKVALLWFVYDLTGSALKMMVIGLLQTIPPLLFGPLIGVCLDRLSKKEGNDLGRSAPHLPYRADTDSLCRQCLAWKAFTSSYS